MVKFTVGLLIAAAVAAPAFVNAAPVAENLETREVAEQDVFGRAVADALSDMYTREEMADILERDVEDFDARELEVLFSRELEFDDSLVTREMVEELEARQPLGGFFGRIKNFFVGKPKPKAPTTETTAEPAATRELEVEVRAEAAAPPAAPKPKHEPNIFEKFIALFRNTNHAGAKKAAQGQGAKKGGSKAAAPAKDAAAPAKEGAAAAPAAEAPAAEAPATEAPAEAREYFDQDLYEREFLSFLEEPVERSFEDDEDMFERAFDEELVEREVDDLLERDFDEELFERELQDMLFEREFSFDELD
jgi:hypothetical protein